MYAKFHFKILNPFVRPSRYDSYYLVIFLLSTLHKTRLIQGNWQLPVGLFVGQSYLRTMGCVFRQHVCKGEARKHVVTTVHSRLFDGRTSKTTRKFRRRRPMVSPAFPPVSLGGPVGVAGLYIV